jgi:alpha-L-rhamnosidase
MRTPLLALLAAVPLALGCTSPGVVKAYRLRCEALGNPLGVDVKAPRLSWILGSHERAQRQTAYRVLAASTPEALERGKGDLWDSGKVESDRQLEIAWAGKPLGSRQPVHWKVRVWDRDGRPSGWSEPAFFEMGLLEPGDWKARWISLDRLPPARDEDHYAERPCPLLRKEFAAAKAVAWARLYATGLGFHEARLNGEKVGDALLDPPWTDYRKRVFYAVHDVTHTIREGHNAIALMLGRGWYDPLPLRMWGRLNLREHLPVGEPRAIAQLEIEYADGTRETVASDGTWKAAGGPILMDSVYLGETHDARREPAGWDRPGFDDREWAPARPAEPPGGVLQARPIPPVRIQAKPARKWEPRTSHKTTEPFPGTFIFDFGENMTGRAVLRVRGPAGTRVTLRYGELLHPDGTLNPMTSVCGQIKAQGVGGPGAPAVAVQQDIYILRGEGEEVWSPRFTFHGFRYIEAAGLPEKPTPETVVAEPIHTDLAWGGSYITQVGDEFSGIQTIARRTFLNNLLGVQSDCPHREKYGYGGDIVATSEAAMFLLDMHAFYAKTVRDFADAALPDGGLTETAPFVGIADEGLGGESGPIGWGTVLPLLLVQLYQYYGDRRLLEEEYPTAKRWVEFLVAKAKEGPIVRGISDHESLEPKPVELTSAAFLYWNLRLVARAALILLKVGDALEYEILASAVREAFIRKFVDPTTGKVGPGTQTAQSFALYLDLVPPEVRGKALDVLVADVAAHDDHLTTGIFGTKFLLDVLSEGGRTDLACRIVSQKTFPGWGYMIERGATTLWEHWEYSDNTYSHDHPMFGSVVEWLFKSLAGIRPAPDAVGFDRFVIAPDYSSENISRGCWYESVRGPVKAWLRSFGKNIDLEINLPPGATAEVHLPCRIGEVVENAEPGDVKGYSFLRSEAGGDVIRVESGRSIFHIPDRGETRPTLQR